MSKWQGELRLAFIDPDRVTFYLHPDDPEMELTPGKRYACVLIEIQDNENLTDAPEDRRAGKKVVRSPSNIAALMCQEDGFQRWATEEMRKLGRDAPMSEETARQYILWMCEIDSRADLDINPTALQAFHARVELPYRRTIMGEKT